MKQVNPSKGICICTCPEKNCDATDKTLGFLQKLVKRYNSKMTRIQFVSLLLLSRTAQATIKAASKNDEGSGESHDDHDLNKSGSPAAHVPGISVAAGNRADSLKKPTVKSDPQIEAKNEKPKAEVLVLLTHVKIFYEVKINVFQFFRMLWHNKKIKEG